MGWTYDSAGTSTLDKVRRLFGDTNSASPLVDDEPIMDALAGATDDTAILRAAALASRWALAAMARDPDRSIEGLQVTRARLEGYQTVVDDLIARAGMQPTALATMSAGNISISSDDEILTDEDYKPVDPGTLDERIGSS